MAMMSRRATAETQGEVQGISAMAMGLGQLFAPLLLTGTMAWFTADGATVHFPGAAFIVAAVFGLLATAMLRRLPRATATADQIPPSVTAWPCASKHAVSTATHDATSAAPEERQTKFDTNLQVAKKGYLPNEHPE